MNWSAGEFESLYNGIESGEIDRKLFDEVLLDLQSLNLNDGKFKNSDSRARLEKGEITLSDGNTYKINQDFMIAAIAVSDELNLDEMVVCEIMLADCNVESLEKDEGIALVNKAKINYFVRRQYILQIVTFLVNYLDPDSPLYIELLANGKLVSNILRAFGYIHTQLGDIKQSISKAKILDSYHALAQQNVKFKQDFLLREYDILSQILHGLMTKGALMSKEHLTKIISHVSEMQSNDFFIIYYLPAIFYAFGNMNKLLDQDVRSIHDEFLKDLKSQSIYTKPVKVSLIFVFLSYFIGWCKLEPEKRANTMDFAVTVDEPMTRAVEYGAIEQLLIFAADTSLVERDASIDLYYDMRSLLERHIPRLIPIQLTDNQTELQQQQQQQQQFYSHAPLPGSHSNSSQQLNNDRSSAVVLSKQTNSFFLATFHDVIRTIIADCAFLLTKIKDAEEDSLLSGEDLDLDDIALKADLERFFLTVYYFYASRPDYSKLFWQDKESNAYGFIEWSAKCHDSLMRSCFYLMISSLSYGTENSLSVYHYFVANDSVSWNIIAQCISDYIVKISNLTTRVQQRQQKQDSEEIDSTLVALEDGLNEEAIIFISSLFTLIGSVANDVDEDIKSTLSNLFADILFEFAKLDTPLIGACLKTLSHLVPNSESKRSNFWYSLDSLIFKSSQSVITPDSYRAAFTSTFTNFSEVVGFLSLFQKLLSINSMDSDSGYMSFGKLAFPSKLGRGYRKTGISPYLDYIFQEILVHSNQLQDSFKTRCIQLPVLRIAEDALRSFDYNVILNSIPAGANLDRLVDTEDFASYVQECPATIAFNYLFTEKVYKCILDIASIGVDSINIDLVGEQEQLLLINLSVKVVGIVLDFQEPYVEEFVPIVTKQGDIDSFIPKDFGLHGLRSFYDALFFNLSVVAHLGLYVGLDNFELASNSLHLLEKLAIRYTGEESPFAVKSKLLTIFDSVDESARIKDGFISQIEKPIDCEEALTLKLELLDFINENLSFTDPTITISHFLLGFQVSNILSTGPNLSTFINSDSSLLKSIMALLEASLENVNQTRIDCAPMRLAASAICIIIKLCRNHVTSRMVLDYLATHRLFERIIELDPQVDAHTSWNGRVFDVKKASRAKDFIQTESLGALLSFLSYRSDLLQYFSLSIHRLASSGRKSQIQSQIELLTSNTLQSAGIFSMLSTLNYGDIPALEDSMDSLTIFKTLPLNLDAVTLGNNCHGNIYNYYAIDSLARLSWRFKRESATAPENRSLTFEQVAQEIDVIHQNIAYILARQTFTKRQLCILHSWVQLVEIIVSDGELTALDRSSFILEVFGATIPKINDYIEFDISFSEELVSLAVTLFAVYQKDRVSIDNFQTVDTRLYNLFKTCIHGINSPLSSFSIRSDFYVLANSYLVRVLEDERLAKQILQGLKMNNEVLVEVICKDTIYGQGTNRITSVFLLDSLVRLGDLNKGNFILDSLTKNTQLLLIIRSIKNTDSLFSSPGSVAIDDLLYELTAFKTVVYLLIRIAESRNGANALIQNKLFRVIEDCQFLKLDPDLGLELVFDELAIHNSSFMSINVSLDKPLFLGKDANGISLFELIVPVFQLLAAVLLSMGSSNAMVINEVKKLLIKYRRLTLGVMKRDALRDTNEKYSSSNSNLEGLEKMVKLVVLLCTLTGYHGEES